jgi:hypothetical protein
MLREIFEWIVSGAGAALGVSVVKGFPTWGRPSLTPPVAALELSNWAPVRPSRIGQGQARQSASFSFWTFARNEPELLDLLDSLAAWALGNATADINSRRVDVSIGDGQRHNSETGAQQEQYGFLVFLSFAWSD